MKTTTIPVIIYSILVLNKPGYWARILSKVVFRDNKYITITTEIIKNTISNINM